MLKLLLIFTIFHLTFAQYWYNGGPPPPHPPPPPPPPGMMGYGGEVPPYPPHYADMPAPYPEVPPPPPYHPGMALIKGPTDVQVQRTVVEQVIPPAAPSLCVCTEASNCKITPKYRCQGSAVITDGNGLGDGVCCPEPEIIC